MTGLIRTADGLAHTALIVYVWHEWMIDELDLRVNIGMRGLKAEAAKHSGRTGGGRLYLCLRVSAGR